MMTPYGHSSDLPSRGTFDHRGQGDRTRSKIQKAKDNMQAQDKSSSQVDFVGAKPQAVGPVVPTPSARMCAGHCNTYISQARLRAVPSARYCVSCQMELGDVPVLRRLDDVGVDGEVHQTYFTQNSELEREMHRRNRAVNSSVAKLDGDPMEPAALKPNPESTSLVVTNLAEASRIQEDALHRAASIHYREQQEFKTSLHLKKAA